MISILKHRVVPAALMSLMVIFLSSCGYHMGSMMHPQIKTVAIAEVRNETREVLAGTIMRKQLAERFQFDNSLKITTPEKADCIVMCRILSVKNAGVVWKSTDEDMTFRPSEFSITVNAEFTVTIPGSAKPLVPLRKVTEPCCPVHNGSLVIYSFGIPCPDPEAAFETEECVSILLKSRAPHGQLMPLDRRRSTVCAILFGAFRHWSGFPVFRCLRLGQFIFLGYPDSPFLCIIQAKTPA